MSTLPSSWLAFLHELADHADAIALRYFRAPDLGLAAKADASPVTLADRGIEDAVRRLARARHPTLGVLGEEEGETGGTAIRLILDPIDGTRNFVRGIPIFATLLGIEEAGEVTAGLVSAPALGVRWHAARGSGAWCGERRLAVSPVATLHDALCFHGSLGGHGEGAGLATLPALAARVDRTRGFGDFYQHVLVAEGAGEIAVDATVRPWDIAALQVIVEEAGGRCTTLSGARTIHGGSLVTTNGLLHEATLGILAPP